MWSERSTVLTVVQGPLCSGISGSLRHRNSNIMFSSYLMRGCTPAQDRNLDEGFKGRKNPQKSGMSSETAGTPSVTSKTSKFQHLSCGNMWKTSQKRTGIRTNRKVSNSYRWYEMMLSCQTWGQSVCTAPWWRPLEQLIPEQLCVDVPSSLLFRWLPVLWRFFLKKLFWWV